MFTRERKRAAISWLVALLDHGTDPSSGNFSFPAGRTVGLPGWLCHCPGQGLRVSGGKYTQSPCWIPCAQHTVGTKWAFL